MPDAQRVIDGHSDALSPAWLCGAMPEDDNKANNNNDYDGDDDDDDRNTSPAPDTAAAAETSTAAASHVHEPAEDAVGRFLGDVYGPALLSPAGKLLTCAGFLALFLLGTYGVGFMSEVPTTAVYVDICCEFLKY